MIKQKFKIESIPIILWGEKSEKLFVVVHGNMSNKEDDCIGIFAEEATELGYQVLSFDLPEHGERKKDECLCKVQSCVQELELIMSYAKTLSKDMNIFACSMGAYFSLLAYKDEDIKQCMFLSPVVNMERIINNMMTWFNISEGKLELEKEVSTPIGQTLYWDYYCYVKENPITQWSKPTSILYGSKDELCEFEFIDLFVKTFNCNLTIMDKGEHYFHTEDQLEFFRQWVRKSIYRYKDI